MGAHTGEQAHDPERVPPQLTLVADPQAEPAGQAAADDDLAAARLEDPALGDLEARPDAERPRLDAADHHVRLGAVDPVEDLDRDGFTGGHHRTVGRPLDAGHRGQQAVALLRVGTLHLGARAVPHHDDDRGISGVRERRTKAAGESEHADVDENDEADRGQRHERHAAPFEQVAVGVLDRDHAVSSCAPAIVRAASVRRRS